LHQTVTNHYIVYTKDGLEIDGIFLDMPMLKLQYAKEGGDISKITFKGKISIRGFHEALMKNPDIPKIHYEGIDIPLTSETLIHWFYSVMKDNQKASPEDFVRYFEHQLTKFPNSCGHLPKYQFEKEEELEKLRLRYLATIFKLVKKLDDDKNADFTSFLDAIAYLSLDFDFELISIEKGVLWLEHYHQKYFCKKCHRMREDPDRSKYCKECRHQIRMDKQRENRGKTEIKRLEFCAGGCGKKLIGKQRVWCGGSDCWLKIYR